jgi:uncharacterized Zn finger protein
VKGNHAYRVKLWNENGRFNWSCTCPYAEEGNFCKHCVAAGIEWLKNRSRGGKTSGEPGKTVVTMDDVKKYLSGCAKEDLVNMLMDQVDNDARLRSRLLLKAAKGLTSGIDMNAFRSSIDQAVSIGEYVSYTDAYDYFCGINEVIDSIEELLKEGYGAEVIDLSEYAFSRLEKSMGMVDDSDGGSSDVTDRLHEIHLKACMIAKPDPVALAKRLFEWEMHSKWEIFFGAVEHYSEIFGESGLAVYRTLAEMEWSKIPELIPGHSDRDEFGKRFTIQHIMESLARQSGNIEELVAIKARNLSYAYSYLEIAEIYKKVNLSDKALEWAEKGMKVFKNKGIDTRLCDFLAEEYHHLKRYDDEMNIIWAEFKDLPSLDAYQKLKKHASLQGVWQSWREKALAFLHDKTEKEKTKNVKKASWRWGTIPDNSLLVEIFLWEKKYEDAWQEAKMGGCTQSLWLELADKCALNHFDEVLAIYQRQVENNVEEKNNKSYEEAVSYIRLILEFPDACVGDEYDQILPYSLARITCQRDTSTLGSRRVHSTS